MTNNLVTLIIFARADHPQLDRCIDSVKAQTYSNIQTVVVGNVDPKSVSGCATCVSGSVDFYDLLGVASSDVIGKYFMTIDSEDWFPSDMVQTMVDAAEGVSADLSASSYFALEPRHVKLRKPDADSIVHGELRHFAELYSISILNDILAGRFDRALKVAVVDRSIYYHSEGVGVERTHWESFKKFVDDGFNCIWRQRLYFKKKRAYKRIAEFKNKYAGKRCFIIGNGPSLRMDDLDKLVDEYTFGMNKVYVAFENTKWRPTFYAIQDSIMLREHSDQVEAIEATYKFVRSDYINYLKNEKNNTYFYNDENRLFNGKPAAFSDDISVCAYEGGTVAYLCMQLAVYMGFTEIYLLGIDFTYNIAKTKDGIKFSDVVNHFSTKYEKDGDIFNYSRLDFNEESFTLAKQITESRGIKIYNATRGGKLEVFERVDFDSLFD